MVEYSTTINGKKIVNDIHIVTDWNGLNEFQLKYISRYWKSWIDIEKIGESFLKIRTQLFYVLMNCDEQLKKDFFINSTKVLDNEELYNLLFLVDWVFERNTLTKNIFPILKVNSTDFYGPNNGLKNITCIEFAISESFFKSYNTKNDIESLNSLIGCLYRNTDNTKKFGDLREDFNKDKIEFYSAIFSELDEEIKQCILLWYIGCRNKIISNFNIIFKGNENDKPSEYGFLGLIMNMAGGKFGDFEKTSNTNLFLFLMEVKLLMQENK